MLLRKFTAFVVVVACTSIAHAGQNGQVVSYYIALAPSTRTVVIPSLPQGFVLTDIITNGAELFLDVYERQNSVDTLQTQIRFTQAIGYRLHMTSGIPFAPQSSLVLEATNGADIMLSGYIPAIQGNAPAVSTWGLMILGILILTCGTLAVMRRKQVA